MARKGVWELKGIWDVNSVIDSTGSIKVISNIKNVKDGETVLLAAQPQHTGSTIVWDQVGGIPVTLQNRSSTVADFIAKGSYYLDTVLVFRVAEIYQGNITADYTYVTVSKSENPGQRIGNILNKARATLGDKNKERYTDEDLLLLLDEAQKDFAEETDILKATAKIVLNSGTFVVDLPKNVRALTRATYEGSKFPMLTYADIDNIIVNNVNNFNGCDWNLSAAWEIETGKPQALIYDKANLGTVRIYPIPEQSVDVLDEDFGVLTGVDEYIDDGSVSSNYGVVTDVIDSNNVLRIYYVRIPSTVENFDSQLEIPEIFDKALRYYIVGQSFLNDLDSGWQEKGMQQLKMYDREVQKGKKFQATNYVKSGGFNTHYRSGF